ncbi:hypothetical protein [Glaciecola sp. SC05]|uniref:hypothetical protein n=1 Tax=Glaciecola sp. SC05 TaxID=1987355 RepID=UPI003528FA14
MLKLKNGATLAHSYQVNQVDGGGDYYRDTLLPLMCDGRWNEIQNHIVIRLPNGDGIKFSSDNWGFRLLQPENPLALLFTYQDKILPYRLRNETKAAVLARMFTGRKTITLDTLRAWLNSLKPLVAQLPLIGLDSFSQLTDEILHDLAQTNPDIFNSPQRVCAVNSLIDCYEELPFDVNFSRQSSEKLGVQAAKQSQHLAIPPRIYKKLIIQFSKDITDLTRHILKIESETVRMLDIQREFKDYSVKQFRQGMIANPFNGAATLEQVEETFKREGVLLVDHLKGEKDSPGRWMKVFDQLQPPIRSISSYALSKNWSYEPFKIGKLQFDTIGKFINFLMDVDTKCKTLCLLLSGMRIDELNSMHPDYGAQSYQVYNQTIHLFTTRQSKITRGQQTEEDIFVTNQIGHKAYHLLTSIHRPYLKRVKDKKIGYFAMLQKSTYPQVIIKKNWANFLANRVNNWLLNNKSNIISLEDESFLRVSNPSNSGIEAGNTFKFTNHQTRRSFAFYMVGLELMAYPQLKKQLSHLSSAMTRHYANNASYWGLLRSEVHHERMLQKSELLASVYKRLAQGGTLAGGKGKILKKLAGSKSYFEESEIDRRLDPSYWRKLIEAGKEHVHAIAPGMYCTNAQCDMRINVALDECVDCEFDFIIDGLYAEGKRLAAHRNLVVLDEMNDLNHNVLSQLVVVIRSCERILNDLEISFTPIELPENIKEMLIDTFEA